MEIDVEFERVDGGMGNQIGMRMAANNVEPPAEPPAASISRTTGTETSAPSETQQSESAENENTVVQPRSWDEDSSDDEEDVEALFRNMTNDLLRDLPQVSFTAHVLSLSSGTPLYSILSLTIIFQEWHPTLLHDLQRQEPLRQDSGQRPPFSSGFLSVFPQK